MIIETYAVLKEFFEPTFKVNVDIYDVDDLKNYLIRENPAAKNVLESSRFAVGDCFVNSDYKIDSNDTISIIPPSSGG